MKIARRTFMQGCCATIAAMSGARLGNLVFAQRGAPQRDIVINVFLRGGMDCLSFLAPFADAEYHSKRPDLGLGQNAGDNEVSDLDGYFGLHSAAAPLVDLYNAQHLALIPATGLPDNLGTRSHFEAQDFMDFGGADPSSGGWLKRYLNSVPVGGLPFEGLFRGISFGSAVSPSFSGFPEALALTEAGDFAIRGSSSNEDDLRRALRLMYDFDPELREVALRTLDATDVIDANPPGEYVPSAGVTYPDSSFSDAMKSIAQMVKLDLGLQAATVDFGGWDTHESQASSSNPDSGYFADQVGDLAGTLAAFWDDMSAQHSRLTMVVMSEFGRRLKENANRGTDHGHGGMMMVFNSNIDAKKVWGTWPGLSSAELFEGKDLKVTTDFRQVLSEIFVARASATSTDLDNYFPGYTYPEPLGIFGDAGVLSSFEGLTVR